MRDSERLGIRVSDRQGRRASVKRGRKDFDQIGKKVSYRQEMRDYNNNKKEERF